MRKDLRLQNEFFADIEIAELSEAEARLRTKVGKIGLSFFGAARMSHNPELLRFGLLKTVFIGTKTGNKDVDEIYRQWTSNAPQDNVETGLKKDKLSGTKVCELIVDRDPAIIVISALEHIRLTDYPETSVERTIDTKSTDRLTGIYQTYEHLLSSIHQTTV